MNSRQIITYKLYFILRSYDSHRNNCITRGNEIKRLQSHNLDTKRLQQNEIKILFVRKYLVIFFF